MTILISPLCLHILSVLLIAEETHIRKQLQNVYIYIAPGM